MPPSASILLFGITNTAGFISVEKVHGGEFSRQKNSVKGRPGFRDLMKVRPLD
jgi:hypothetical protein